MVGEGGLAVIRKTPTEVEVKFALVAGNEVFEPADWWDHFFVPLRNKGAEVGAALRVRKSGRGWKPFDERPLHAELSFFLPEEPGRIAGNYR